MFGALGHMLEKMSTRRMRIAVVVASIVLAELLVGGMEYALHRTIRGELIIRTFVTASIISVLMTQIHAVFINRLRETAAALRQSEAENRATIDAQKAAEAALYAERASLAERVEERTAALHAANAQLLQAIQAWDEFLRNINHELRTPLTPIVAFTDLLQNELYGPLNSRQKQISANIQKSAQELLELINTILDFSDIKAGELRLKIESFDVHALCQTSLRQIESAAQKKNLRVSYAMDSAPTILQADPYRVKQMLGHLLQNAVKFTPKGGAIGLEVSGNTVTHTVRFSVWDTGIGIDSAYLPQLFQPFKQLPTSSTREYEGAGIGLALVHYLAELHGGSVTVESQAGQGSRFTISLPWNVAPTGGEGEGEIEIEIEIEIEGEGEGEGEGEIEIEIEGGDAAKLPITTEAPPTTREKPLILVAEDNAMNMKVLCHILNMAGYDTIVAEDGVTAVEATRAHRPALVLMDIQMPGMNGLEATRHIRADAAVGDTPIIAVTALTMPGDRERSLEAGVNHYLSKPMDMQKLLKIMADILHPPSRTAPQIPDEQDPHGA